MLASKVSLLIMIKALSILSVGAVLLLTHTDAAAESFLLAPFLAQMSLDTADPSAFKPPAEPRPDGILTTTGTHFRPPNNPRPLSGPRTTTGTRTGGCLSSAETAFAMLGPTDTVGRTLSSHPEFVWYLPESEIAFPVSFRLLSFNEQGILVPIHTTELSYAAGFTRYQLPLDRPALAPDQEYRWQIIIACNPNYPSRSLAQELSFEVVPSSATLTQAIASSTSAAERAAIYGEAGIWYDAIAQVAQATTATEQELRAGLLRDLATTEVEDEQLSRDILDIVSK